MDGNATDLVTKTEFPLVDRDFMKDALLKGQFRPSMTSVISTINHGDQN